MEREVLKQENEKWLISVRSDQPFLQDFLTY